MNDTPWTSRYRSSYYQTSFAPKQVHHLLFPPTSRRRPMCTLQHKIPLTERVYVAWVVPCRSGIRNLDGVPILAMELINVHMRFAHLESTVWISFMDSGSKRNSDHVCIDQFTDSRSMSSYLEVYPRRLPLRARRARCVARALHVHLWRLVAVLGSLNAYPGSNMSFNGTSSFVLCKVSHRTSAYWDLSFWNYPPAHRLIQFFPPRLVKMNIP